MIELKGSLFTPFGCYSCPHCHKQIDDVLAPFLHVLIQKGNCELYMDKETSTQSISF